MAKKVETDLARLLSGRLKGYLERSGMTVAAFAKKANVSTPSVYQILRGEGKQSQMMVARVEAGMRDESTTPPQIPPKLGDRDQEILGVILEEALTKKVLDRLIQHVIRATEDAESDKMRMIAESLLVAHLVRFEGKDLVRELLQLHDLVRSD